MSPAHPHAARFQKAREVHRTELAEDYVEVVLDLQEEFGEARMTEVAQRIGVAHPTVVKAMRRLEKEGLVELEPYRPVRLTPAGRELALACRTRHRIVKDFLVALGLSDAAAELEAEGMEHHVGKETLALMQKFTASRPDAQSESGI